jgi:hypothetical protein
MSAQVTIPDPSATQFEQPRTRIVNVPAGNAYAIDESGRLIVKTSQRYGAYTAAVFKEWYFIVIDPRPDRGPDGRFVKRGN